MGAWEDERMRGLKEKGKRERTAKLSRDEEN